MLNLILIQFFGLLTPGPDFFYVSRMAASNLRRNVTAGIVGITLGVTFWATTALLGLKILFDAIPVLHGVIVLSGGSYLCYLGILMLKSRENVVFTSHSASELNQATTLIKEVSKGLFVNLSNAKAIIYFASVMSSILGSISDIWQMLTALFLIAIETFLYFYIISILFSRKIAKQFYSKYSRYIDNIAGAIFLLFGGGLVYTALNKIIAYL